MVANHFGLGVERRTALALARPCRYGIGRARLYQLVEAGLNNKLGVPSLRYWKESLLALWFTVQGSVLGIAGGALTYLATWDPVDPEMQRLGCLVAIAGAGLLVLGVSTWRCVWRSITRSPRLSHFQRVREECRAELQPDTVAPQFHLVLLNDDTHSFQYVITLLRSGFGLSVHEAFALTRVIDTSGRGVACTGTRREVDLMRDWILAYGPDPALPASTGPLQVLIEPVERASGAGEATA